jgi:hypothetical protein
MNSAWADTKQLKGSLHGQGNVKWKFWKETQATQCSNVLVD